MYKLNSIIFLFISVVCFLISGTVEGNCDGAQPPWVALRTGCVQGLSRKSVLGRSYYSFEGIPYALPPVGGLRFKAPQPPSNWPGVLHAVEVPAACLQPWRTTAFPITYSEDCLYVNVFTPYLQHPSRGLMPVIVWIHGGKFYQGSSSSYSYGVDFLLMKDVVIVTMNYRLGVFGYLNLNISEVQGNAGMKDIVAALRWVKREISKFGGDPNLVTISGGSSGAGDVSFLYISPMGVGLFDRAISNSGAALCAWGFLPSTTSLGLRLAHLLGCPTDSPHSAAICLRTFDAVYLAEKQMLLGGVEGLDNPFVPSIEFDLGEEVFLPDSPQKLITSSGDIPYMMGINNGEGLMFVEDPNSNPDQFTKFEEDVISYLPVHILKNENENVLQSISLKVKDFYIGHNNSLNNTMYGFVNYMTDRQFGFCILKSAQALSIRAPVYLYYFIYEGEFERKDHSFLLLNMSGVCHGEELGYIFYRNYTVLAQNNISAYPRDMGLVKKMVSLWTNFAAYGNPTSMLQDDLNITWEPVEGDFTQHLIIGDSLEMATYPLLEERVMFWNSLYSSLLTDLTIRAEERNNLTGTVTCILFLISGTLGVVYIFTRRQEYQFLP